MNNQFFALGVPKAVLCLLLLAIVVLAASPSKWKRLGVVSYDWNKDGEPERFILDIPEDWEVGGEYSRLRILLLGRETFVVQTELGWTKYDSKWFAPRLRALGNPIGSEYLLFLPSGNDAARAPLLVLTGWPYGSSPGSLHVIVLDSGFPRVVFAKDAFELVDYADLDGDGFEELIGPPCLSQAWGPGLSTYTPYHVYKLPMDKGNAILSIPLSKEYNLKHYYVWAGPECSEELAVFEHPRTGKRVVMKARDAEKLFEKYPPRKR